MTVVGIDAHKDWHTLVAVDEVGKRIGVLTVEARAGGHRQIMTWLEQFEDVRMAVEDCRHLTRRLEADLLDAGHKVVRVHTRLMAGMRRSGREPGKSDPLLSPSGSNPHRSGTEPGALQIYTRRGELFTRVAFEDRPDGTVSEVSYVNGAQQGPARDLTATGRLIGEDTYHENARHGLSREFDADGRVVHAGRYEYNIRVRSADVDPGSGGLVWRDEVEPGSAEADLLDRWRSELHWPTPGTAPSAG